MGGEQAPLGGVRAAPLERLAAALAPEFGDATIYRPYRDTRFSNDKTPYKDHQGAVVSTAARMGWYVQVGAEGLLTAGGWYASSPDQIARYRAAVDDDTSGRALEAIAAALAASGYELYGDALKAAPRGFTVAHPRIGLLRRRQLLTRVEHGTPDWLDTPEVVERVAADWRAYRPLLDWLAAHVGPPEGEPRR